MLPKPHRLPATSFNQLKKPHQTFNHPFFSLVVLNPPCPTPPPFSPSRYGFIISTKISKKATQRNKLKRLLSQAIKNQPRYLFQGKDIVFLAKKKLVGKSYQEIFQALNQTLKKLK